MEYQRLKLTEPTSRKHWLGVDPGLAGGMALVGDAQIEWAVEWAHDGDQVEVTDHLGGRFRGRNLSHALQMFWSTTRHPSESMRETPATVELTNIHGARAGAGKLLKATGYIQCWLDTMGCIRGAEPQQTTWVADLLACPPGESEKGILAALQGVPLPGSRRIVDWGLSGPIARMVEPGRRGRPRFGKHAGDAVALALWGSGRRLTRLVGIGSSACGDGPAVAAFDAYRTLLEANPEAADELSRAIRSGGS